MVSLTEGGPHHWDSVSLHVLCQSHLNRASPALNWGYGGHRSLVKVPWNPRKGQGDPGRSGLAPEGPGKSPGRPEHKRPQGSLGKPVEIRKATEGLGKPLGHPWKPRRLQGGPGKPLERLDVPGRPGEASGMSGRPGEARGSPWDVRGGPGDPRETRGSPWDVRRAHGGPGKPLGHPGKPRKTPGKPCEVRHDPGRSGEVSGTSGGPRRSQGSPGKSLVSRGIPRFHIDLLSVAIWLKNHGFTLTPFPWRP